MGQALRGGLGARAAALARVLRRRAAARAAALALAIAAALGPASAAAADAAEAAPASEALRVFAAASLTEAFRAINVLDWCGGEPRAELYLAESSTLVAWIERGAPADVVATADRPTMQRLVDAGRVETPQRFARGELVIGAERGDPKRAQRAEYWIALVRGAARPDAARAFVTAVLSPRGQAVLARHGFAPAGE